MVLNILPLVNPTLISNDTEMLMFWLSSNARLNL